MGTDSSQSLLSSLGSQLSLYYPLSEFPWLSQALKLQVLKIVHPSLIHCGRLAL